MIEFATKRHSSSRYPNLSFEVMDAGELSFKECFDVAFSNAALHWVKNHKPVLEGWIRTTWLPYTERIPEDKRDDFIEAISEKYMESVPVDSDGNVHVAMVRIEVAAEKAA